jgi:radical SAM superfamily enzyme YgiQ (UPF0313 family)
MPKQEKQKAPVVLVSLNAKFIHSNLAIDYLRAYCEAREIPTAIQVFEFHINQPVDYIVGEILSMDMDIIGFSCYIWNIAATLHVISRLKLARPEVTIIVGGPEVSYETEQLLLDHPEIDYCITGEGEQSFADLLSGLLAQRGPQVEREGAQQPTASLERRIIPGDSVVLDELASPYPTNLRERYRHKLVYLETSRGCPFSCQYCLSANTRSVRYFPWERVKAEFIKLLDAGFPQIKLIDRTFNANPARALQIFRFLVEENAKRGAFAGSKPPTIFHFEISADILTEGLLSYLEEVPPGLFQFEIGIQSTTPEVLTEIQRRSDWQVLSKTIKRLAKPSNIHLHLDLIAGLPQETFDSFQESFDDVYGLGGQRIQLGFLKLLKGSGLRQRSQELGLIFDPYPPYEIIATPTLSALEIVRLKEIESLLEQYYNSHRFTLTLEFLTSRVYTSPFEFFRDLATYFRAHRLHQVSHSPLALYDILYRYLRQSHPGIHTLAEETLKFDFLRTEAHRPLRPWMSDKLETDHRQLRHQLLQDPSVRERLHPATLALSPREMAQKVRIGRFSWDFVELLCQRDTEKPLQELELEGGAISLDTGWVIFNHHRPDPWTKESAYTVVLEDR